MMFLLHRGGGQQRKMATCLLLLLIVTSSRCHASSLAANGDESSTSNKVNAINLKEVLQNKRRNKTIHQPHLKDMRVETNFATVDLTTGNIDRDSTSDHDFPSRRQENSNVNGAEASDTRTRRNKALSKMLGITHHRAYHRHKKRNLQGFDETAFFIDTLKDIVEGFNDFVGEVFCDVLTDSIIPLLETILDFFGSLIILVIDNIGAIVDTALSFTDDVEGYCEDINNSLFTDDRRRDLLFAEDGTIIPPADSRSRDHDEQAASDGEDSLEEKNDKYRNTGEEKQQGLSSKEPPAKEKKKRRELIDVPDLTIPPITIIDGPNSAPLLPEVIIPDIPAIYSPKFDVPDIVIPAIPLFGGVDFNFWAIQVQIPYIGVPQLTIDTSVFDFESRKLMDRIETPDIPEVKLPLLKTPNISLKPEDIPGVTEIFEILDQVNGIPKDVIDNVKGFLEDAMDEVYAYFLQPISFLCGAGLNYLKVILIDTFGLDKLSFDETKQEIEDSIEDVKVLFTDTTDGICGDGGIYNEMVEFGEMLSNFGDNVWQKDVCETFEEVYPQFKLFTSTGIFVSGLLDNFINAAPECDTTVSAAVAPGAGEACMAATSGYKATMVTAKTVFDTVVGIVDQIADIHDTPLYESQCSCFPEDAVYFIGSGCDGIDQNCDEEVDDCDEDRTKPILLLKSDLIPETPFRSDADAIRYLKDSVIASDDCALSLTVDVTKDENNSDSELSTFVVSASDPRCEGSSESATESKNFILKVDTADPIVTCGFSEFGGMNVVEDDKKLFHYGDVELLNAENYWYDSHFYYNIEDPTLDTIDVQLAVRSNELQPNPQSTKVYRMKSANYQEQVKIYFNATSCDTSAVAKGYSNPECESDPSIAIDFRFYEIVVTATDSSGRTGSDTCHIIVVPECDEDSDDTDCVQDPYPIFPGKFYSHAYLSDYIDSAPSTSRYLSNANTLQRPALLFETSSLDLEWTVGSLPIAVPAVQKRTNAPSSAPSLQPSSTPSLQPSRTPSLQPSRTPSLLPSNAPSVLPSTTPSSQPSTTPSSQPSTTPSTQPSTTPSSQPSTRSSKTKSGKGGKDKNK